MTVTVTPRELTDEQIARGTRRDRLQLRARTASSRTHHPASSNPIDAVRLGFQTATQAAIADSWRPGQAVGGLIGLNPDGAADARGPIGIAQETGAVLEAPLVSQLLFVGVLSVNLASSTCCRSRRSTAAGSPSC